MSSKTAMKNKNMARIGNQNAKKEDPRVNIVSFKVNLEEKDGLKKVYGEPLGPNCRDYLLDAIKI